jgi:hypothetical protein
MGQNMTTKDTKQGKPQNLPAVAIVMNGDYKGPIGTLEKGKTYHVHASIVKRLPPNSYRLKDATDADAGQSKAG